MTKRPALIAIVVVLLLAVGGGAAAWALFLRGDEVAPLALPSRAPAAPDAAGASAPGSSATTASLPPASPAGIDPAGVPGTWTIGPDSIVGYRVRERLASLAADSDAVGRTGSISGSATIAASGPSLSVTAAEFSVDMTTLTSDRQMRDNRLRHDGIQTDAFPTATFRLTAPVALPAGATSGRQLNASLHGDLTLHGVTKSVDIPATAQLSGSIVEVVGSLDFPFSDFAIDAPNIGGFVSVEDHGTLEFLVNLTKA